jgi:hypothetical protein
MHCQKCIQLLPVSFALALTVNKTMQTFSAIALYQTHEQLNAIVKSNGGTIGLTESHLH